MSRATGSPPVRSLACTLAIVWVVATGCTGELTLVDPAGGGGGGGGADGGGGGEQSEGQIMFNDMIDPMFSIARPKGACVVCHGSVATGPDFLGMGEASERYPTIIDFVSAVTGREMVGTSAADSELLLKGDHPTGDEFCTGAGTPYAQCTEDEVSLITSWIALEQ